MKLTPKVIQTRIKQIVDLANSIDYSCDDWQAKDTILWNIIRAQDVEVGEGLKPGRHVKWPVADGYAHYFVVKVGKTFTELVHIPYADAYQFAGTFMLKNKLVAPTSIVEETIKWDDNYFKVTVRM